MRCIPLKCTKHVADNAGVAVIFCKRSCCISLFSPVLCMTLICTTVASPYLDMIRCNSESMRTHIQDVTYEGETQQEGQNRPLRDARCHRLLLKVCPQVLLARRGSTYYLIYAAICSKTNKQTTNKQASKQTNKQAEQRAKIKTRKNMWHLVGNHFCGIK